MAETTAGNETMQVMVLETIGSELVPRSRPIPQPAPGQVLIQVEACAVCRTDLHVIDGELPDIPLPIVPGHEIVGRVRSCGEGVLSLADGDRVGVPWLASTCQHCRYCERGQENLCEAARFTGYQVDGGYAEYVLADADYVLVFEHDIDAVATAPLLCAGLIGYRSLRLAGDGERLGLYGFGAAAHIVSQIARHQGREIYAFTRPGDTDAQAFARQLGATWTGGSDELPPEPLDAAIIYAPVGELVPAALQAVDRGGTVVCAGIHMSDIPAFPYRLLWQERRLLSVANLTRDDGREFLQLLNEVAIETTTRRYALTEANTALADLRTGRLQGAAVLVP